MVKKISILGSTGSIGRQALEVIEALGDKFEILALTGGSNVDLLNEQIKKFRPKYAYSSDLKAINGAQALSLEEICANKENDIILVAVSGKIGLKPTITAINSGIDIALANKETLVMAGDIVMSEAKKYGVKIYSSEGTISALRKKGIITDEHEFEVLDSKEEDIGFAVVRPFFTSHDCSQGMGYVISGNNGESVAVCTDLGYISDEVKQSLCGCKSVVIESNHDVMMLQNGPYPYYLKRRILSNVGHLSNDSCAEFLPYLVNHGTKNIILSHLSEKNNIPELAMQTALYSFENHSMKEKIDFNLFVSPKINHKIIDFVD